MFWLHNPGLADKVVLRPDGLESVVALRLNESTKELSHPQGETLGKTNSIMDLYKESTTICHPFVTVSIMKDHKLYQNPSCLANLFLNKTIKRLPGTAVLAAASAKVVHNVFHKAFVQSKKPNKRAIFIVVWPTTWILTTNGVRRIGAKGMLFRFEISIRKSF